MMAHYTKKSSLEHYRYLSKLRSLNINASMDNQLRKHYFDVRTELKTAVESWSPDKFWNSQFEVTGEIAFN